MPTAKLLLPLNRKFWLVSFSARELQLFQMLKLKNNQAGFIPMMIAIVLIILAVIVFAYFRVAAKSH